MLSLYVRLMNWLEGEEGQSMAEYALIIALVAIVLIAALQLLAGGISGVFSRIVSGFSATGS